MNIIECNKVRIDTAGVSALIPEGVRNDLKKSGNVFLTVYSKKSRMLRFFPVKDEEIWWLKIVIDSISPQTSGKILAKLNKIVSEIIYSTGVCIAKSDCFWDGLITQSAVNLSKDKVISELEEIPNVIKVEINNIE
ncbi:MAG: hypothetical protein ACTSQ0_07570 [Candidatus Heimdallarchaeota archaeon]